LVSKHKISIAKYTVLLVFGGGLPSRERKKLNMDQVGKSSEGKGSQKITDKRVLDIPTTSGNENIDNKSKDSESSPKRVRLEMDTDKQLSHEEASKEISDKRVHDIQPARGNDQNMDNKRYTMSDEERRRIDQILQENEPYRQDAEAISKIRGKLNREEIDYVVEQLYPTPIDASFVFEHKKAENMPDNNKWRRTSLKAILDGSVRKYDYEEPDCIKIESPQGASSCWMNPVPKHKVPMLITRPEKEKYRYMSEWDMEDYKSHSNFCVGSEGSSVNYPDFLLRKEENVDVDITNIVAPKSPPDPNKKRYLWGVELPPFSDEEHDDDKDNMDIDKMAPCNDPPK
ncbi:hypothetical protein KI387_035862, partial [Taxus chinensis]